jgi:apolipoprotein D and lipocalin family protein
VAIAGHPTRRGLWLLARTPRLPDAELQRLIGIASDLGYDTSRLVLARPTDTLH